MSHLHFNIAISHTIKQMYPWLRYSQVKEVRLSLLENITQASIESSNELSSEDWLKVSSASDETIREKIAEIALRYV